jgi:4-hydroxybenzoate polyprenyltransferase
MTSAYRTTKARTLIRDFFSMTRIPFSFTQTLFIILGFVYAGGRDPAKMLLAVIALGPTLIYGGVYILNDTADREFDIQHPKKRHRVITSGRMSVGAASTLAAALITAGLAVASYIGFEFTLICAVVVINNLAYSYGPRLKERGYAGLLSCSLNYPLRFMAGSSIVSISPKGTVLSLLFFLIALNGFSAYRIYNTVSTGIREKTREVRKMAAVVRITALTAAFIAMSFLRENAAAALGVFAYMLAFSEINLGVVRRGVDFFQLLRVWKTLRENPGMLYYPVMTAMLGAIVVYITIKPA